jgi:ABC-type nitrate/sulfonate/bicarbonate transport system substrate-binding protein
MNFKNIPIYIVMIFLIAGTGAPAWAQITNIRIAYNGFGGTAPIYLGQDAGIFKKQNLNLEKLASGESRRKKTDL